jgi:hypothetical protein
MTKIAYLLLSQMYLQEFAFDWGIALQPRGRGFYSRCDHMNFSLT